MPGCPGEIPPTEPEEPTEEERQSDRDAHGWSHPDDIPEIEKDPEGEGDDISLPPFGENLLTSIKIADNATVLFDLTPVDWTAVGTRLTPVVDTDHGNAKEDGAADTPISAAATDITLPSGTYRIDVSLVLTNADTEAQTFDHAITNPAGTTVHKTEAFVVPKGPTGEYHYHRVWILKFGAETTITFRAAQSTGAETNLVVKAGHIMTIQRLGTFG